MGLCDIEPSPISANDSMLCALDNVFAALVAIMCKEYNLWIEQTMPNSAKATKDFPNSRPYIFPFNYLLK